MSPPLIIDPFLIKSQNHTLFLMPKLDFKSCVVFIVRECLLLLCFSKAHFFTKTHGLRFYCLFGSCSEYINRRYVHTSIVPFGELYWFFLCSEYRYYPSCLVFEFLPCENKISFILLSTYAKTSNPLLICT